MAELVAALFELLGHVVQLCIQLVALVLEALGFSVGHLADKPEKGERRFSGKRLLVAFAPLAVVLVVIVGTFMYFDWSANVRRAKENKTTLLIEDNLENLAGNVDDDGHLVRHPVEFLAVDDAWGNPLRVDYDETLLYESVSVRSDGADRKADTTDDLSSSRQILRSKKDIAEGALDKAKDLIRDRIYKRD